MGGGDLNLKKSWHPSTLRNIERVWKAEQKHEVEKQKIEQLQKELAEERAREEIQTYAEDKGVVKKKDERLDWMYQGPAAMVNREEYLLGRKVDKTLETLKKIEEGKDPAQDEDDIGSRMFSSQNLSGTATVDLATKIREDPLFSIMKKEKEERKNLLSNPVKMKQLQQMLEESLAKKKSKKSKKKKHNSDSEEEMPEKRRKKHKKQESSESEKEQKPSKEYSKHMKGDKPEKKRKHQKQSSPDSEEEHRFTKDSDRDYHSKHKHYERERSPLEKRSSKHYNEKYSSYDRKIRSDGERNHRSYEDSRSSNHHRQSNYESSDQRSHHSYRDHQSKPYDRDSHNQREKKRKIDPEERERLLREMQENAKWTEDQRKKRTQRYKEEEEREEKAQRITTSDFTKPMLSRAVGNGSLENRIKQKIFSLQRGKSGMDKNFAKRE